MKSANLDGDLGDDGADSACSSGILFLAGAGAGAEGGVTEAAASGPTCGCGGGLVRQRRAGVEGLLPPPPMPEKNPPSLPVVRGLGASCGRRLVAASWSSRRTDVHSALRHPVPIFFFFFFFLISLSLEIFLSLSLSLPQVREEMCSLVKEERKEQVVLATYIALLLNSSSCTYVCMYQNHIHMVRLSPVSSLLLVWFGFVHHHTTPHLHVSSTSASPSS